MFASSRPERVSAVPRAERAREARRGRQPKIRAGPCGGRRFGVRSMAHTTQRERAVAIAAPGRTDGDARCDVSVAVRSAMRAGKRVALRRVGTRLEKRPTAMSDRPTRRHDERNDHGRTGVPARAERLRCS
jgi:hypothetical protein